MLRKLTVTGITLWTLLATSTLALAELPLAVEPGVQPYQQFNFADGSREPELFHGIGFVAVPEGKRLVAQHVSVRVITLDPELDVVCHSLASAPDGNSAASYVEIILGPPHVMMTALGPAYYFQGSQPVTQFVGSGRRPGIGCQFSEKVVVGFDPSDVALRGSITGYLIDAKEPSGGPPPDDGGEG